MFVQSLLTQKSFRSRPIETGNRMNENGLFVIDAHNSQSTVIHHAQPAVDMESLQPVERALFWVGALITASLALWLLYKIITGFRIWVLGNGDLLSPKLGKWAGLAILVFYFCLLVNNVGISYPYPEFFLHIPDLENFITNMINVNITSVCQMTRLVLPRMEARAKGVILNISSASGMFPVPLLTIYSSTKAFVDFFSLGLQAEYKCKGIIIQSVLPFFVATKMTRIRKPTLDKPTPERYVAAELTTVGLQDQTNGYFPHAVMVRQPKNFLIVV
ncbi:very-long-chain 3-oxoacyl-CoA reductase-A-like [Sinocyclocheilus grahami]|uniref:very-long-chain 3-oxoacyl-CoA reductase-A-like n=1 Tax=Sinocyclocheilus grahami TaxID=75366 RepID=UPI0007ACAB07|nr:PREDICTED: very-long-chain 3-oxoacyl-CoA reductase-A-like [Sinocyclocheilus grahami]